MDITFPGTPAGFCNSIRRSRPLPYAINRAHSSKEKARELSFTIAVFGWPVNSIRLLRICTRLSMIVRLVGLVRLPPPVGLPYCLKQRRSLCVLLSPSNCQAYTPTAKRHLMSSPYAICFRLTCNCHFWDPMPFFFNTPPHPFFFFLLSSPFGDTLRMSRAEKFKHQP